MIQMQFETVKPTLIPLTFSIIAVHLLNIIIMAAQYTDLYLQVNPDSYGCKQTVPQSNVP